MELTYHSARPLDLQTIVDIYNSTIALGNVTADTQPVSGKDRVEWFKNHSLSNKRPLWLVKQQKKVVGWVSFQSFYGRPAYQQTAEISIYLHPDFRQQGLGKIILNDCIEAAKNKLDIKTLLGFIFEENTTSMNLFARAGFERWGLLPGIARMNDGTSRNLAIVGKHLQ